MKRDVTRLYGFLRLGLGLYIRMMDDSFLRGGKVARGVAEDRVDVCNALKAGCCNESNMRYVVVERGRPYSPKLPTPPYTLPLSLLIILTTTQ